MYSTRLAFFFSFLYATSVSAQATGPCGWDAVDLEGGMPRSFAAVAARAGAGDVPEDAVANMQSYVQRCDQGAGKKAIQSLRGAVERNPKDDALKLLLAMSMARGPEVIVEGGEGTVIRPAHKFSNSEKEARRLMADVAARQEWPELANEVAALAMATRSKSTLTEARAIIDAMLQRSQDPRLASLLAEIDIATRNYPGAIAAATIASKNNNAAGLRSLGIAQLLNEPNPSNGAGNYMKALATADDRTLQLFFEDVHLLLTEPEEKQWRALAARDARIAWLQKAWNWRAAIATVPLAERLAEHFRRLTFATDEYSRQSYRGVTPFAMLWSNEWTGVEPLDDRGIVYVRHGPPDQIVKKGEDLEHPRMAWLYRGISGGRGVLEFIKDRSRPDYYLPDPSLLKDPDNPCSQITIKKAADWKDNYVTSIISWLFWEADGLDNHLNNTECHMVMAGDAGITRNLRGADLRRVVGNAIYETETAVPKMKKPIRSLLNTYAFRSEYGTEVWTIASAQAGGIIGATTPTGVSYSLRLFAGVEDAARHEVVRSDPKFETQRPAAYGPDDLLQLSANLISQPSPNVTVRVAIRNQLDTLQGEMLMLTRPLPAFKPDSFSISDIVLAEAASGNWSRNGIELAPLPAHRATAGSAFRMYYEVYGVTASEPLEFSISVAPGTSNNVLSKIAELVTKKEALTLSFVEQAATVGDMHVASREVLADLKPGNYVVTVTVKRQRTGESRVQTTNLTVNQAPSTRR